MELSIKKMKGEDLPEIVELWEAAVRASHTFLKEEDILFYREVVKEYFSKGNLIVAKDSSHSIIAFYSVDSDMLDTLFVSPAHFRQGIGTTLINDAISRFGISSLEVNEQNISALAFYQKQGFNVTGRRKTDDFGKPYPILRLERKI